MTVGTLVLLVKRTFPQHYQYVYIVAKVTSSLHKPDAQTKIHYSAESKSTGDKHKIAGSPTSY